MQNIKKLKVREISKQNAALVREAFHKEKQKEIQTLYNKHQVYSLKCLKKKLN
jgi:hypothetical protein